MSDAAKQNLDELQRALACTLRAVAGNATVEVAFRGRDDRKRVSVDAAGYRARRRETIERQAQRAAERALETGKEIVRGTIDPPRGAAPLMAALAKLP